MKNKSRLTVIFTLPSENGENFEVLGNAGVAVNVWRVLTFKSWVHLSSGIGVKTTTSEALKIV